MSDRIEMIGTVTDFEPMTRPIIWIGFARVEAHLTKWIDPQNQWLASILSIEPV
jgi:hypothetical protein